MTVLMFSLYLRVLLLYLNRWSCFCCVFFAGVKLSRFLSDGCIDAGVNSDINSNSEPDVDDADDVVDSDPDDESDEEEPGEAGGDVIVVVV